MDVECGCEDGAEVVVAAGEDGKVLVADDMVQVFAPRFVAVGAVTAVDVVDKEFDAEEAVDIGVEDAGLVVVENGRASSTLNQSESKLAPKSVPLSIWNRNI